MRNNNKRVRIAVIEIFLFSFKVTWLEFARRIRISRFEIRTYVGVRTYIYTYTHIDIYVGMWVKSDLLSKNNVIKPWEHYVVVRVTTGSSPFSWQSAGLNSGLETTWRSVTQDERYPLTNTILCFYYVRVYIFICTHT